MTKPLKIKDRQEVGALCDRLGNRNKMLAVFSWLMETVDRWTVVVQRSAVDPVTGDPRESYLTFRSEDSATEEVGREAAISRRCSIVLETRDHGIAHIDFTNRQWSILVRTEDVKNTLEQLDAKITEASSARFLSHEFSFKLFFSAFFGVIVVIAGMGTLAEYVLHLPPHKLGPTWFVVTAWIIMVLALIAIMVSFAIRVGCNLSGGLRITPRYLSLIELRGSWYRMKNNPANRGALRGGLFGVMSTVIAALLLYVLLGK